jgi:hypothetical protein
MRVTVNGWELNVVVMGPPDGPVPTAHHGGGGIGSLAEPKATFGPPSGHSPQIEERELFLSTVRLPKQCLLNTVRYQSPNKSG